MNDMHFLNADSRQDVCPFDYDLNAMSLNAKLRLGIAQENGFSMRAVVKGGYLNSQIIEEIRELPDISFAVGSRHQVSEVSLSGTDVSALYPGQGDRGPSGAT